MFLRLLWKEFPSELGHDFMFRYVTFIKTNEIQIVKQVR
jgi:hypothetical protein